MKFLSPEAIIVLPFAITIDLISIILVIFALDDFWITDIIAITFLGGWSFFRAQTKTGSSKEVELPDIGEKIKAQKAVRQTGKGGEKATKAAKWTKRLKWLRPIAIIGEIIPYFGVLPLWTLWIIAEIQTSEE